MKHSGEKVSIRWYGRAAVLVFGLVLLLLSACSEDPPAPEPTPDQPQPIVQEPVEPEFLSLLPGEAHALLGREPAVLVIDVRTDEERALVRIPGARNVVFEEILQGHADLPRDRPLLLVCTIGGRSYAAALVLAEAGYPRLYNLRGGLVAWEKAGLPVEHGAAPRMAGQ